MTSAKSTRSDAVNNRERILSVARDAFGSSTGASLTAIAKQAGVGIGTLYRHFPNRESLIVALYRHHIQEVIDLAPTLAATRPALPALRAWLAEVARYGQLKYGAAEVIHAATNDAEYYQPFVDAIATLLDAGAAEGTLKTGVDPEDVLSLLGVLWRIDPARAGTAGRVERILELIVDGLRAPVRRESVGGNG
ncbi:MAG TPA: TetR/AcrR family transcriptional regulator [Pseudonocardiaceae bacterium]|nr:TetR/AcrR family transcriptional regulator [Pseudonocardiaceae bacterium]